MQEEGVLRQLRNVYGIKCNNFPSVFFSMFRRHDLMREGLLNLGKFKYSSSFILIFLVCYVGHGQVHDSFSNESSNRMFESYDTLTPKKYKLVTTDSFSKKAVNRRSAQEMNARFYMLEDFRESSSTLAYLDGVIHFKQNSKVKAAPICNYIIKAYRYEQNNDFINAIVNYLNVHALARELNNTNLMFLSSYSIGILIGKINAYELNLKLLKMRFKLDRNEGRHGSALGAILKISNMYAIIKNVDSLRAYTCLGKELSLKLKDTMSFHHLLVHQSIAEYQSGNLNSAILNLEKERRFYEGRHKQDDLIFPYFHLAKAYALNADIKTSISYLKKVDSIVYLGKIVHPLIRETYELLIEQSKDAEKRGDELFYKKQLVRFDSVSNQDALYLSKQLYKEYNISKLKLEEKIITEKTLRENSKSNILTLFILWVLLILFFLIVFFQLRRRKFSAKRAESIKISTTTALTNNAIIPGEIVEEVLLKLEVFEQEKQYLSKNITLNSLAKEMHTNTNYLSKIINTYKRASFSNYLNTLRITYIVHELNVNNKYSKYTIQALAEVAGFNASESFGKAFYKITKSMPSDYINKLDKKWS